jgi:cytochrome P450
VLKESLRLHHIGASPRQAVPGSTVTFEGRSYPIDNHQLLILGGAIQRDPTYFYSPNTFDPDRFLRPDFHPDSKAAWMPFEKGPRDCLGQQLAILEMKLALVLTLRFFEFETMYAEDAVSVPG